MTPPTKKVVICADTQRAILMDGAQRQVIWFMAINAALWLLGELFHVLWLPAIGIIGFAAFCIVPRLLRINRSLAQIACPACGRSAGAYFTENSRVHLRCQHCSEVSPTDCGVGIMGGIPYKITR